MTKHHLHLDYGSFETHTVRITDAGEAKTRYKFEIEGEISSRLRREAEKQARDKGWDVQMRACLANIEYVSVAQVPRRNFLTASEAEALLRAGVLEGVDDSALDDAVVMLCSEETLTWWYAPARDAIARRDELERRQIWMSEGKDSIMLPGAMDPPPAVDTSLSDEATRSTELEAVPLDPDVRGDLVVSR